MKSKINIEWLILNFERSYKMITQDISLQLSGASHASLTVNGNNDFIASGASILKYKGTGEINYLDLSGGSQILKMD